MTINQIARVWLVYGTELQEELECDQQRTDSDADNVMQQ